MSASDRPAAGSAGPSPRPRSERLRSPFFWLLAVIVLPIMNLSVRWRIRDAHKLPKQGAFILAPNHLTEIDPVVMGIAMWKMGRVPRFLAKASLFRVPVLGGILRASGQIPVERGAGRGADPLAAAGHLLAKGHAVIVYPEGTLTREPDLWPMRGRAGAVRAALEHGIPIIPVAHWGSQQLMARYGRRITLLRRKPVDILVGDPVDLGVEPGTRADRAAVDAGTDRVMHAIAGLLGELRGETPPAELWDPAKHDQKEAGRP
ncbi:lysophospholipid acyltransferase family protein [Arenivirga flava]|uniref:1-acyl-sn-glycerol-3-phosphate acyltransferase n=1 Tax=Arenivirga flava TaxID=1930060 RepID=A0AA37XAP3_9MICO|nr:lysophospholipid acyltransferase family protein [Arenivirga flava]GMA27808.1 1-acyl-sn-glycerol-3-phosphate acyltransferase [Arenivirga flava]